ncbi:MAG TPA: GNAT family protein [Acidimicrobiales bacterium]|jgi:RimJ/RimL family protein N-acetyltransferase
MAHPHWPLFDLVVRSPRLEIRLAREEEFPAVVDVIDGGIHDPATMPFTMPWTDTPVPQRWRDNYQWWWTQRSRWSVDDWNFDGVVFHHGQVVGVQSLRGQDFARLRAVETGSWLGQRYQGQGFGKEMRAAILQLAFAGLGAKVAYSGAFLDNQRSAGTSRALGYRENGRELHLRRGEPDEIVKFRLDRAEWEAQRRPDCSVEGLEGCLDMFGVEP